MKKYRVKPYYYNTLKTTRFVVERRYWLLFWSHVSDYMLKEEADADCKKRNDFVEFE